MSADKEELIKFINANNRICPLPVGWDELYSLLRNKKRKGNGWEPALPLILAAWWDTTDLGKKLRLIEHIEWAEQQGQLKELSEYLYKLNEDQWYHAGD